MSRNREGMASSRSQPGQHITITDNAIILLKERVVDRHYDPKARLVQLVRRK